MATPACTLRLRRLRRCTEWPSGSARGRFRDRVRDAFLFLVQLHYSCIPMFNFSRQIMPWTMKVRPIHEASDRVVLPEPGLRSSASRKCSQRDKGARHLRVLSLTFRSSPRATMSGLPVTRPAAFSTEPVKIRSAPGSSAPAQRSKLPSFEGLLASSSTHPSPWTQSWV